MAVKRYELGDAQWLRIESLLPGKVTDPGREDQRAIGTPFVG